MIDHVFKRQMDKAWEHAAVLFVRAGITPNAVTLASFVLVLATSAAFVWHQNALAFALTAGAFELLDNIDGAIARVAKSASRAGAFLDATTDRLKEVALFCAVAEVSGAAMPAMLALSLGLCASYNLARGQAEGARFFAVTPPLFERLERITILCVGVALSPWVPIAWTLWLLVAGNAVTVAQRLWQGFFELRR